MLLYNLKLSACLIIFISFYKLILERESFHLIKRIYLIAILILSICIPLISFTEYVEIDSSILNSSIPTFKNTEVIKQYQTIEKTNSINWLTIIWIIYILGALSFLFRFILNLKRTLSRININPKAKKDNFFYVLITEHLNPHSFFNYIFLNYKDFKQNKIPEEILLHEQTHVKQRHSLDIIITEIIQICFWFNPLIFLIKNDIKLNHEFLADNEVIRNGVNKKNYQRLLIEYSTNTQTINLGHPFNYKFIKKRLKVMKTKTPKFRVYFKNLLIIPLITLTLYGFSNKKEVYVNTVKSSNHDNLTNNELFKTIWIFIGKNEKLNITNYGTVNIDKLEQTLTKFNSNLTRENRIKKIDAIIQINYETPLNYIIEVKNKLKNYGVKTIWLKESDWADNITNHKSLNERFVKDPSNEIAIFKINGKIKNVIDIRLDDIGTKNINGDKAYYLTSNNETFYWNRLRIPIDQNGQKIKVKKSVPQEKKATKAEMEEYNRLIKSASKNNIYKQKDIEKMYYIYNKMSSSQKKSVKNIKDIIPPPPPKPTVIEVKKVKNTPPPPKPIKIKVVEKKKMSPKVAKKVKEVKVLKEKKHEKHEKEHEHEEEHEIEIKEIIIEEKEHVDDKVYPHKSPDGEEIEIIEEKVEHKDELEEIIVEEKELHDKETEINRLLNDKNITYYINGKKASNRKTKKLKPENIKKIDVVKSKDGKKGEIYIYTK